MFDFALPFLNNVVAVLAPLIGVIILGWITFKLWVHYIRQDFISGITWSMLEIIPPRDVLRSPRAMELFLSNALYHWSEKGGLETYWQGAVWFWHSLEIASIDGQVHFYVRTPSRIRDLVETQIYAQYPQAQVKDAEDYTLAVDEISKTSAWNLWGCEFKLTKPEVFSIKTYLDFGLDKDPKEEFKVDPISGIIEFFASLKKGEQAWMQIVVRPAKKEYHTHGSHFWDSHKKKYHDWVEEGKTQIIKTLDPYTGSRSRAPEDTRGPGYGLEVRSPGFMDEMIKAAGKKMTKIGFDTGIRVCYVAKKEIYPLGTRTNNSRNIRLIFRQYANPFSNELFRHNSTQADYYGGWYLISGNTVKILANRHLKAFREREFFYLPLRHHLFSTHVIFWPFSIFLHAYKHPETFILNVEELATLWHFPGQILKVPTLERIESKEASPPPNLPM